MSNSQEGIIPAAIAQQIVNLSFRATFLAFFLSFIQFVNLFLSTMHYAMKNDNPQAAGSELFAERFRSARLYNGFSLQDLAEKMGNRVTRQALHKYEKGEVVPDSEMLGYLAEAMGVRPDFFFRETRVEIGPVEFRKLKRLPVKEQNRIIEHTKDVLRRYLELEEIIGLEIRFKNPLAGCSVIGSFADVERAALKVREFWKLGSDPISNCIELLEDNHIKVIELESHNDFDGMQTWVNGSIPVIVINCSQMKSTDRVRFTVLHELGHLLLPLNDLPVKEKETFCHQFAAAMLIPRETAEKELGKNRNKLFVQELGFLKKQYGISIQALVRRAHDLGIIGGSYLKQFLFLMDHQGWMVKEPHGYEGVEKSNRFDQLLLRALAEELVSISKAAALANKTLIEYRKQLQVVE
jgi:Zn-dependent peptidase ImmA (M78 family)